MRVVMLIVAAAISVACQQQLATGQSPTTELAASAPMPVALIAADGVKIAALHYRASRPKALILLFHQAGSSKGEYATIAPRLIVAGYSALAIDQRSGGDMFGRNGTAAALGREADYTEARKDLDAALAWAAAQGKPVIIWGSSYSAALAFQLAADNPQVAAVLAFSPGEYLGKGNPVAAAAARVRVPIFVTSASAAGEVAAARAILAASPAATKNQYIALVGVHGSSTLIPASNARGAAANWEAALAFLNSVAG